MIDWRIELATKVREEKAVIPYNLCGGVPISHLFCIYSVLNVKPPVGTFNQEKALVGASSLIMKSSRNLVSSCSVQVSWLRWADMSVLTVGGLVFSSDPRLVVAAARLGPATLAWKLYISEVSPADSGDYQCQINTEPKQSLDVTLMVSGVSIDNQFYE